MRLLPTLLLAAGGAAGAAAQVAGGLSHLLIDPEVTEVIRQVEVRPGRPSPLAAEPLLEMDTPAEAGDWQPWFNVILDPHEKFYKAWYGRGNCCYGTSHDGLLWNKPLLDLHPDEAGGRTGILIPEFRGAAFLRRESESGPEFHLIGQGPQGLELRQSEDGVRFSDGRSLPGLELAPGSHAALVPSLDERAYFLFFRQPGEDGWVRSTSADLEHWEKPRALSGLSAGDELRLVPRGRLYLAALGIDPPQGRLRVGVSADGLRWTAYGAAADAARVQSLIVLRDEIRIYYTEGGRLRLAGLPADRWAGLTAAEGATGTVITHPLRFAAPSLRINAEIEEGGSVEVALLNDDGSEAARGTVRADGVDKPVKIDLPQSGGRGRFRLRLRDATVYSIRFGG